MLYLCLDMEKVKQAANEKERFQATIGALKNGKLQSRLFKCHLYTSVKEKSAMVLMLASWALRSQPVTSFHFQEVQEHCLKSR